jgi:hypothetical protein
VCPFKRRGFNILLVFIADHLDVRIRRIINADTRLVPNPINSEIKIMTGGLRRIVIAANIPAAIRKKTNNMV